MKSRGPLLASLSQTTVLFAGAIWASQWRPAAEPLEREAAYLVWVVGAAAGLAFLIDLVFWAQGTGRLRAAVRLPDEFSRWVLVSLQIVRTLSRDSAWLLATLGVLFVLGSEWTAAEFYNNLVRGIGICLAVVVVARSAAIVLPVAAEVVRFPLFRLAALAVVYVLLHQAWPTTYGFPDSPLLPALLLAVGLSYFGSILRNIASTSHRWTTEGRIWPGVAAEYMRLTAGLLGAASLGTALWGCLSTLPNVSASLLGQWPYDLVGTRTQPLFGLLYEARYLIAGLWLLLVFSTRLPTTTGPINTVNYMPLLKATGLSLMACITWIIGANLATLGHGYALLGAIIATGLFTLAISRLARYSPASRGPLPGDVIRWFAGSSFRAFSLGSFLAAYGLLLRPLFYDMLWFAPIFEWLVVLTFAVVAIMWSRTRIRPGVAIIAAPIADWLNWSRHVQTTEERRDPHLDGLLTYHQIFIATGEWQRIWGYFLGLMLRNQVSMQRIPPVFEPFRSCYLASTRTDLWPRKAGRLRKRREKALSDTIGLAEAALSCPKSETEELDELRLWAIAEPFVELGADPTELAVALSNAYWQRGADLNQAVDLWFPLMTLTDRPRTRLLRRLVTPISRLLRRGRTDRTWDRERRLRILDGAISHLFLEVTCDSLAMAIVDQRLPIEDRRQGYYLYRLSLGEAVEILEETRDWCRFRPGEGSQSYTLLRRMPRRPVLPKDYPIVERRLFTA